VAQLSDGTATIDIDGPDEAPSGGASRLAVAQIVLTATSVPGVDAVRLTLSGEPVEAPLPSGQLTSAPLTAADYAALLVPGASFPS
jgi:spore germination protein GerM